MCKQKTAYEMRISDWSSDVCSSDLILVREQAAVDCGAEAARAVSRWGAPEIRNGDALLQWIEQELNIHRRLELRCFPGSGAQYLLVDNGLQEIGRTSCRERVCQYVSISVCAVYLKKKNKTDI